MKLLRAFTRILLLPLVGMVSLLVFAQNHILYQPHPLPRDELVRQMPQAKLWPSTEAFRGLLFEPVGLARGTVELFHGNAGHVGHRLHYAETLTALGWRVLLAEYPGYGPREGELGEDALVSDAADTLRLAQQQFGPLVLIGESLGAGVAAAASARLAHRDIAALLLLTPWDTLAGAASHHYPWLPVSWLLRDRYNSVAHLQDFPGRLSILVAEEDQVIPAARGRALHAQLPGSPRLIAIPGVGHNDWFYHLDQEAWRHLMP